MESAAILARRGSIVATKNWKRSTKVFFVVAVILPEIRVSENLREREKTTASFLEKLRGYFRSTFFFFFFLSGAISQGVVIWNWNYFLFFSFWYFYQENVAGIVSSSRNLDKTPVSPRSMTDYPPVARIENVFHQNTRIIVRSIFLFQFNR